MREPEKACPGLDPGWISVFEKDGRWRGSLPRARHEDSRPHHNPLHWRRQAGARRSPAFRTQTRLRLRSNRSLFATRNSAGKEFGEARDRDGIFGGAGRFRATETDAIRVSGGKAAESQRQFRRRQETGIAQDCVVVSGGLKLRAMHAVPSNRSLRMMFLSILLDCTRNRIADQPHATAGPDPEIIFGAGTQRRGQGTVAPAGQC
jgi:hypothetical protein